MKNQSMKMRSTKLQPVRSARLHPLLAPADVTTSLATSSLLSTKKPPGFGE